MARETIDGIEIDYELLGDAGAPAIVLTPGGRFAKETIGIRAFADALTAAGRRVLLWDRPNCGASDMHFGGPSESDIQANALVGLLRTLDLGPVTMTGGSGGARVALIAAARDPSLVGHLVIWWISGDPISLAQLAAYYCGDSAIAAARGGMERVAALPGWAEQMARNPRNRDIVLRQDPDAFIAAMQRWARAYAYSETSPVPGMTPESFARLTMPTRVYRSGKSDISHTRRTSEWVAELIPNAEIVDPPWGDQEWNERSVSEDHALFRNWVRLAPELLAFTDR